MTEKNCAGCDCALAEKKKARTMPPLWAVVLLNDDYTTMDFVVSLLVNLFGRTKAEAQTVMMSVHRTGRGVAGVFTRDIAESLAARAMRAAREEGFPLRCEVVRQDAG